MMMAPGILELVMFFSMGGLISAGGVMGLPPGERDDALVRTAPAETLMYTEWSARSAGKAGAPGLEGMAADPEIREFLTDLERAIRESIERETQNSRRPEQRLIGKAMPTLMLSLVNHSGCVWVSFDPAAAAKGLVDHPEWGPRARALGLEGAFVVNAGKEADDFAAELKKLLPLLPGPQPAEGLSRRKLLPAETGIELVLHRKGQRFVLAVGEGTLDVVLAGLDGKPQGLSESKRYQDDIARVDMSRVASISWTDMKGVLETVRQALGPQGAMVQAMAGPLGIDQIGTITSCTALVEGRIRTRTFIETGGSEKGLLALAAGKPLAPAQLELIPADADFVAAGSLDAQKVLAATRKMVGSTAPDALERLDAIIDQLENELGLKLEDDIFAAFGDTWTIYDSPSGGGMAVSGAVLSLEVRDPRKANATFSQLMKVLAAAVPGDQSRRYYRRGVYLADRKFLDRTIYYVNTVGDDVPVAPAFCITDAQLLVSLHPQGIKAHLRFLAAKKKGQAEQGTASWKLPKLPEGELIGVSYLDTPALIRSLYAFAPWFGQLAAAELQQERFEMDVFSLPSARAVLPYIQSSSSFAVRQPEGLLFQSDEGIPFQQNLTMFAKMGAASSLQYMWRRNRFREDAIEAPAEADEAIPANADDEDDAPEDDAPEDDAP